MPSEDRAAEDREWQRLDKWLWCARVLKERAACARLVAEGRVRINRQPTDKPHARLRVGDVVTLAIRDAVRVLRIERLAGRRGPASEARGLYEEIDVPCQRAETLPHAAPGIAPHPAHDRPGETR